MCVDKKRVPGRIVFFAGIILLSLVLSCRHYPVVMGKSSINPTDDLLDCKIDWHCESLDLTKSYRGPFYLGAVFCGENKNARRKLLSLRSDDNGVKISFLPYLLDTSYKKPKKYYLVFQQIPDGPDRFRLSCSKKIKDLNMADYPNLILYPDSKSSHNLNSQKILADFLKNSPTHEFAARGQKINIGSDNKKKGTPVLKKMAQKINRLMDLANDAETIDLAELQTMRDVLREVIDKERQPFFLEKMKHRMAISIEAGTTFHMRYKKPDRKTNLYKLDLERNLNQGRPPRKTAYKTWGKTRFLSDYQIKLSAGQCIFPEKNNPFYLYATPDISRQKEFAIIIKGGLTINQIQKGNKNNLFMIEVSNFSEDQFLDVNPGLIDIILENNKAYLKYVTGQMRFRREAGCRSDKQLGKKKEFVPMVPKTAENKLKSLSLESEIKTILGKYYSELPLSLENAMIEKIVEGTVLRIHLSTKKKISPSRKLLVSKVLKEIFEHVKDAVLINDIKASYINFYLKKDNSDMINIKTWSRNKKQAFVDLELKII